MKARSAMKWTKEQIPNLEGKNIIITGGNSGIGFDAAKACMEKGAHVIIACRSEERGRQAIESLEKEATKGSAEFIPLDLASLESVQQCADTFLAKQMPLHILVNNAGIMMTPYSTTKDGFESQLGVNHFGHYALTGRLLPALKKAPKARVVNVSSLAHAMGKMDFENLQYEGGKGYSSTKAYGRSKLANLLFTFELQRKFDEAQLDIIAVAAHPGVAQTNLARHIEKLWYLKPIAKLMFALLAQPSEMGALPTLRALSDPEVEGADYFGPDGFREQKGHPVKVGTAKQAQDEEAAKKLWHISEQLTKVQYEFQAA